jgi:RNA polymerase sigma factor (sigma-70 family)
MDQRTKQWGKWRPSARARRLGERAVRLDRLIRRDGLDPEHATTLVGAPPEWTSLLMRPGRRVPTRPTGFVDLNAASSCRALVADPLAALMERQLARKGAELGQRLERALATMPVADQVLIRMRHEQGLKVREIATMLGVDQGKLYRRLAAVHHDLRTVIQGLGVSRLDAADVLAGQASHLPRILSRPRAAA